MRYYYERFEKVDNEIVGVSKKIPFVMVRVRHNRFGFWVRCGISEVWIVK